MECPPAWKTPTNPPSFCLKVASCEKSSSVPPWRLRGFLSPSSCGLTESGTHTLPLWPSALDSVASAQLAFSHGDAQMKPASMLPTPSHPLQLALALFQPVQGNPARRIEGPPSVKSPGSIIGMLDCHRKFSNVIWSFFPTNAHQFGPGFSL